MAGEFYVMVEGTKQGKFKGEGLREKRKDAIPAFGFSYEVTSPRDSSTGQSSGKRQHHPVMMTKEWGASTPQFHQAIVTNEVLKTVVFEFVHTTPEGAEEVYFTIRLTNATVASVKDYTAPDQPQGQRYLQDISFVFQSIVIESMTGKTSSQDDWVQRSRA